MAKKRHNAAFRIRRFFTYRADNVPPKHEAM
jgi:hypothetical protein